MNPQLLPAIARDDVPAWQQTLVAFLAEKERRSGSHRTVESYARMLWPFLLRVGSPDLVTPAHVLAWAHGIGVSGREPSSTIVGARIACLSSYYRFLIRMNVATSNPCDALERPRTVQSVARGLSAEEVRRLLAVVPDSVAGRRDRALLLVFVLTGRRRAEVIGLTAGDISIEGETAFYSYRGKGGKRGRSPSATTSCAGCSTARAAPGCAARPISSAAPSAATTAARPSAVAPDAHRPSSSRDRSWPRSPRRSCLVRPSMRPDTSCVVGSKPPRSRSPASSANASSPAWND